MAVLTDEQLRRLGVPPKPPAPQVAIVDVKTGKPTAAYADWLAKLDNWQRTLAAILGE
jgi:hypothetical protein